MESPFVAPPVRKSFHLCQSITGPLRNWSARQWDDATSWITHDDGTSFPDGKALKAHFQSLADKGIKRVPIGDCDNFDNDHGCRGHPPSDLIPTV